MKANDLRIGNKVFYNTDEELEVTTIDWEDMKMACKNNDYFNKYYSPIPLTEEWLLKMGFEKDTSFKMKFNFLRFHLFQINASNNYNNNENEFTVTVHQSIHNVQLCRIKFVHQLQNLYYALTNEELTIK